MNDMDKSFDKTLASREGEYLASTITTQLNRAIANDYPRLSEIWAELWDPAERQKRREMLESHMLEQFTNVLATVLSKEQETKEEYILRIEKLLDEISTLECQLKVTISYNDVETLPLHNMAMRLSQKALRYRTIVEERRSKLGELRAREVALEEALGALPTGLELAEGAVPSEAELEALTQHVDAMEAERRVRAGLFLERRERVMELYRLLGSRPSLLFEKDVVAEDRTSDFKVTNENMARLDELLERLERQLAAAAEQREDLVRTLRAMWSYLEEPLDRQQQILRDFSGCTPGHLDGLQVELDRCKQEKSANIGKFVARVREELVAEWDRCLVGEAVRAQLRVFRLDYFNEDMYDLHELELARWQRFYADNLRLFELYAKHTQLFEKLLELNGRGKSADRYQNRGGQLLQEERQRKVVAKDLPRVETELRAAVKAFEDEHNEPFLAFDRPLLSVLNEKWAQNFDQKTIDKFRDGGLLSTARTPLAAKRPATSSASTGTKFSRLAPPSTSKCASARPAPRTEGPAPRAQCRLRLEQVDQPEPDSTITLEPSYEDFHKTFKMKLGRSKLVSRSTEVLTPTKHLRERNALGLVSTRSSPMLATPTPKSARRRAVVQTTTPARTRLPFLL